MALRYLSCGRNTTYIEFLKKEPPPRRFFHLFSYFLGSKMVGVKLIILKTNESIAMTFSYFDHKEIKRFLLENKNKMLVSKLGIELTASLVIENYERSKRNDDLVIGLPLITRYDKVALGQTKMPKDLLDQMLLNGIEDYSLTDFSIVPKKDLLSKKPKGLLYQVKNIGRGNINGGTEDIIKFLETRILNHFQKSITHLLLILTPQTHELILFDKIHTYCIGKDWPFSTIKFCGSYGVGVNLEVILGELFPSYWQKSINIKSLGI